MFVAEVEASDDVATAASVSETTADKTEQSDEKKGDDKEQQHLHCQVDILVAEKETRAGHPCKCLYPQRLIA